MKRVRNLLIANSLGSAHDGKECVKFRKYEGCSEMVILDREIRRDLWITYPLPPINDG